MQATVKANSDLERHYFEQFRKCYALPEGQVEYGDKPDVVVKGRTTTGIEITNFYLKPGHLSGSEQRQRQLREGVIADAQTLYRAAGGRGIELTIGFDATHPVTAATRRSLPARLAGLAQEIDGQTSGDLARSLFRDAMPELASLFLNANDYSDAQWRIMQVHAVSAMSTEDLEAIVRNKEAKASSYRLCDLLWLLVVVDWIDPAQEQEIRVEKFEIRSDVFDKIIVYKPNFGHIVELT